MPLPLFHTFSYGMARTYRPPMGSDRSPSPQNGTIPQRRQAADRRPKMSQWHPVGAQDRSAMERDTAALCFRLHVPPTIRGMGARRCLPRLVGGISSYAEQGGAHRLAGVFRGRQLRFRKKGGAKIGTTKRGKGTKWMMLTDGAGIPVGTLLDSASPAEVRLAEQLRPVIRGTPQRLVADRGYDSNRYRRFLVAHGIDPIIPARGNNRRATHQDGRKLRRYRHRWIVERTFAWLGWFRCLVVRWTRKFENYLALFHLACAMITLRRVLG